MKISILTPDFSNNSFGRTYILAKVLQRKYNVEIIGPMFGETIWKPLAHDRSIPCKLIKMKKSPTSFFHIRKIYKEIEGDVIYAIKPTLFSFNIGLLKKITTGKPLILDIDDWELGFLLDYYKRALKSFSKEGFSKVRDLLRLFLDPYKAVLLFALVINEKLIKFANKITVSNSFLKKRFGKGIIIPHGRDTKMLDPNKFNKFSMREKYKLDKSDKIIIFLGTPRPHKGIEILVEAISVIRKKDVKLLLVGVDYGDQYCKKLLSFAKRKLGKRLISLGMQPFEKVPEFLSLADVVVIPQQENKATIGQVPAKVFDAMAMAQSIVATDSSGLDEILEDCGWVVESEHITQLADTIQYVLKNPNEARKKGLKARKKCVKYYSWNTMEKSLEEVFKEYEKKF